MFIEFRARIGGSCVNFIYRVARDFFRAASSSSSCRGRGRGRIGRNAEKDVARD
jgi:hypothetical protein